MNGEISFIRKDRTLLGVNLVINEITDNSGQRGKEHCCYCSSVKLLENGQNIKNMPAQEILQQLKYQLNTETTSC